jgi:hypothetical protein
MRDPRPPRQPLFWAASSFPFGLWTGARVWCPLSMWMIAILFFLCAAAWFLTKRATLAKALFLAVWVLLGALFIQIRSQPSAEAQRNFIPMAALADGSQVTLTALVKREGYAQAAMTNCLAGSLGCWRMTGTGCVGAMLKRGLQSSSSEMAVSKYCSIACLRRESQ